MAKKDKDKPDKAEEETPKKGGKRVVILAAIIVAIAVLGGGAMAGGFLGGSEEAEASPTPEPTATAMELGNVVELDSVTLNLAGDDNHFLKLGVAIETDPSVGEEPPTAPVYDVVIDQFSDYTFEQLSEPSFRDSTKEQMLQRLSEIYGSDIVRVYYTEFVMQ